MNPSSGFVKSAKTTVSVAESQGHIISVLHRYGASGFGFRRAGDVVTVTFHIPAPGGVDRTVAIPVNLAAVRAKLNPKLDELARDRKTSTTRADPERAERVAWRILLDWIDAALSAVSIGAQSIERGRLIDYVETIKVAGADPSGRMPSPGRTLQLGAGGTVRE